MARLAAAMEAPASVLGLEGDNAKANEDLTIALRKAFAVRGYSGGEEISLAELRLTMGCESNDPGCLASGGEALQVRRLVYGSLTPSGGGDFQLELSILSVEDKVVEQKATIPVKARDLQPDRIDAKATEIVGSLFPEEADTGDLPAETVPFTPIDETGEPVADDEPKRRKSGLVWGPYSPRPTWKWALFGTSVGLMGLSAVALAVTGIPVARSRNEKGFLYENVVDEARLSLEDDNPDNNVDPDVVLEICASEPGSGGALEVTGRGTEQPPGTPMSEWNGVRNADVAKRCNNGESWAKIATASAIAFGVFTVTTAAFTTLLFVHREKPAASALLRRGVTLGAAPNTTGDGFVLGGGLRF